MLTAKISHMRAHVLKASLRNARNHLCYNASFGAYYRPDKVFIAPTLRCNLRCAHCYLRRHQSQELNTAQWKQILRGIRKWLGPFYLDFTLAGEPLLRDDIYEIIAFAHSLDIVTMLSTNGTLVDQRIANALIASGLDMVYISLDGAREETHDVIRGKGAYRAAMNAIMLLKDTLRVYLNTTIMQPNMEELLSLVEFAQEQKLHVSFMALVWDHNNQHAYSHAMENPLWPHNAEKLSGIIEELVLLKKKNYPIRNSIRHLQVIKAIYKDPLRKVYGCAVAKRAFLITPEGHVLLCGKFSAIGDLSNESPASVWSSQKAASVRKEISRCTYPCTNVNCGFFENFFDKIGRFKSLIRCPRRLMK